MTHFDLILTWSNSMRNAKLRTCEWQNYTIYLLIYSFSCLVLFYTLVYYDCFRFVCTFELLYLNNCKIKRSKQRTLFKSDVFAKTKKWEGAHTVVVSGTYVKCCY